MSLLLLILFGFGIWAVVERGFTSMLGIREPSEQAYLDATDVTTRKAELTDVQTELAEVQKYLNAARLEELKQNAAVQSYKLTYPQLQDAASPANVPPETVRAYTETRRQATAASSVVSSLGERLLDLKDRRALLSAELDEHTEIAEARFRDANRSYAIVKRGGTFILTLAIVAFLLWVVRTVLWAFAKKRMSTAEGFRPFVLAFGALALLFAYDQFSFAGAALVGVLLLFFILRRINWPRKSSVLVK